MKIKMKIAVHSCIESMHNGHGLRHDDYKQYHGYCTRRLSRIRHNREVRKDLVHSATYVSGEKTRRHAYCSRDPVLAEQQDEDLDPMHENMLLVVLVDAERAWAHSSELKALLHDQLPKNHEKSKASPGSIRQHALRRLRRAKQLAIRFEELCIQFSDETTQDEAKAYASWMRGNFALEASDWQTACAQFQDAISLCRKLAQMEDDLEISDLFTGRANNVLKPLLKYCQYEWKEAGGDVVIESEEGEKSGGEKESAGSGSVTYRGQRIVVENKSLKVLLLKAEGLLVNTVGTDEEDEVFVSLLSIFDDSHAMVAADLQKFRQMKAGPAVNSKRMQLEQLSGYIRYQKLQLSMQRHEQMIARCKKAADCAHLYDALLHDVKAVCELPGPEEEDEFFLEANANVLRVRAFRAFYVAQLYMSLNKFTEALGLMKQSKLLADKASEEIAACDDLKLADAYLEELELLMNDIAEMTMRVEARSYLGMNSSSVTGDILSNLDEFAPNNNLTEASPIPAPAKPTFFDVAWNHASSYPHEELKHFIDQNKPKGSSGLLGWFRSS